MSVWSAFNDWLLPELAGVPPDLVTLHLRQVATEFMDRTGVYNAALPTITIVANTGTYTPAPPSGYEVARITQMRIGEADVFPRSIEQLMAMFQQWETASGAPPSAYFTQETLDTFRLVPYPTATYSDPISLRAVLRPTKTATQIPDWIFNSYVQVIAAGVKGCLMSMPQKPWTDLARAAAYYAEYSAGVNNALVDVNRSFTRVPLQVQMRRV